MKHAVRAARLAAGRLAVLLGAGGWWVPSVCQAGGLNGGGGLDAGDLHRGVVLDAGDLELGERCDERGVEADGVRGGDPGGRRDGPVVEKRGDDDADAGKQGSIESWC